MKATVRGGVGLAIAITTAGAAQVQQVSGGRAPVGGRPALGSPSFQVGGVTVFVLKNLPSGTYSWRIGSMYATPKAVTSVSTAASALPQVTVVVP